MALKKTIGKNGKPYYFDSGRRVSELFYKLHWYEGGKGRMKNEDFQRFYSAIPKGSRGRPRMNTDTIRTLQNRFWSDKYSEMEEQKLENRIKEGKGISEYVPHFNLSEYADLGTVFFIKDFGTPGFQRVSKDELLDIIAEKGREANKEQRKNKQITNYMVYTEDRDGEEYLYFDFTDFFQSETG